MNSRLDEMQAAILSERQKWLPDFSARRRQIAGGYRNGLRRSSITLLAPSESENAHVYHLFAVCCDKRDALQAHLHANGVQTLVHYPIPVHHQKSCSNIARDPNGLRNSEVHALRCLSLPCHPQLSDGDVDQVIEAVNSFKP
jgi:dTDP-4-amino-4,6-dideoxygalactose transaminase